MSPMIIINHVIIKVHHHLTFHYSTANSTALHRTPPFIIILISLVRLLLRLMAVQHDSFNAYLMLIIIHTHVVIKVHAYLFPFSTPSLAIILPLNSP
jgi:hypothetical protein